MLTDDTSDSIQVLTSYILHIMQAQSPLALVGDSFVLGFGRAGQQCHMTTGQQDYSILTTAQHFNDPVILLRNQTWLNISTSFALLFVCCNVRAVCVALWRLAREFGMR